MPQDLLRFLEMREVSRTTRQDGQLSSAEVVALSQRFADKPITNDINLPIDELHLDRIQLDMHSVAAIIEMLEKHPTVLSFHLSHIKLNEADAQMLAEGLAKNKNLTHLVISFEEGIRGIDIFTKILAAALANNQMNLSELCLAANSGYDNKEGIEALTKALETNQTLTSLMFEFGTLRNEKAVDALWKALEVNQKLTTLSIESNNLGDAGAQALAKILTTNQTLKVLALTNDKITDVGVEALAKALETNKTLTKLDLRMNDISDQALNTLANALEKNFTLTEFKGLRDTHDPKIIKRLEDCLARNIKLKAEGGHVPESTSTNPIFSGLASLQEWLSRQWDKFTNFVKTSFLAIKNKLASKPPASTMSSTSHPQSHAQNKLSTSNSQSIPPATLTSETPSQQEKVASVSNSRLSISKVEDNPKSTTKPS